MLQAFLVELVLQGEHLPKVEHLLLHLLLMREGEQVLQVLHLVLKGQVLHLALKGD